MHRVNYEEFLLEVRQDNVLADALRAVTSIDLAPTKAIKVNIDTSPSLTLSSHKCTHTQEELSCRSGTLASKQM